MYNVNLYYRDSGRYKRSINYPHPVNDKSSNISMNDAFFNQTISSSSNHGDADTKSFNQGKSKSNRILYGSRVTETKYPWEILIFSWFKESLQYCDGVLNADMQQTLTFWDPGSPVDDPFYDICSGSLITNKHILTSAECLLRNRKEIEDRSKEGTQKAPHYNKAECLFVYLGFTDRDMALNSGKYETVKSYHIHDQAFSDIYEYNYKGVASETPQSARS